MEGEKNMNKAMDEYEKKVCPVCGKQIVLLFEICDCGWQNDPLQYDKPDYKGGANIMSLNEAREAYQKGKTIL